MIENEHPFWTPTKETTKEFITIFRNQEYEVLDTLTPEEIKSFQAAYDLISQIDKFNNPEVRSTLYFYNWENLDNFMEHLSNIDDKDTFNEIMSKFQKIIHSKNWIAIRKTCCIYNGEKCRNEIEKLLKWE